ncbi:GLPGLI family protein [Nonlabens sp.]|uniref:GLPGLI family protein n=1 Tax=Nonlabens sp. TaxID=1888209 RepID=UPI003F69CF84
MLRSFIFILISTTAFAHGQDNEVYQLDYSVTRISSSGTKTVDKYILNIDSSTYRYEHVAGIEGPKDFITGDYDRNPSKLEYDYHIGEIDGKVDFNLTTFPYKNYNVVDSLPDINWIITNEVKSIGGYKCSKGTGNYRGRVIDAFFTTEIPITIGPNNLNGLPGAIIFAQSRDRNFTFQVLRIDKVTRPERFTYFESFEFGDLTTMRDWLKDYDDFRGKLAKQIKLKYQNKRKQNGDNSTTVDIVSNDRNLLELFYEWQLDDNSQ